MRRFLVLFAALAIALTAPAALAEVAGTYDVYDLKTFNNTGPDGAEVTLTTSDVFDRTLTYDSSTYTTNDQEHPPTGSRDMTGCVYGDGTKAVGGRDAWVRFNPGVAGRVTSITATTNYDVELKVWKAPVAAPGQTPYSTPVDYDCIDAVRNGPNERLVNIDIDHGEMLFVQTLGVCSRPAVGASWATACPKGDASAPGGANQLRLVFQPADADGDGVPDSIDQCNGVKGNQPNGCVGTTPTPTPMPTATPTPTPPPSALKRPPFPVGLGVMPHAGARRFVPVAFGRRYPLAPPRGARVVVTCTGRACPASARRPRSRVAAGRLLRFPAIAIGRRGTATITLSATRPGYIGNWSSWTLRRGISPSQILRHRRDGCLGAGGARSRC